MREFRHVDIHLDFHVDVHFYVDFHLDLHVHLDFDLHVDVETDVHFDFHFDFDIDHDDDQPDRGSARGDIFEVELRRCFQVLTGYRSFPAGTVLRWRVIQLGQTVDRGHLVTESGSNYHFLIQRMDQRLKASPVIADIHYLWTIKGIDYHYFVRREPGCSGTTWTGQSGPGNMFMVTLRRCHVLHVGYQFFPANVLVVWIVKQGTKKKFGMFRTESGSTFHFLKRDLGLQLKGTSKASVVFHWNIKTTHYHYAITRTTGC